MHHLNDSTNRSSLPEVLCKKGALRNSQNSQENTCFCEISKSTFLHKTPLVAASVLMCKNVAIKLNF